MKSVEKKHRRFLAAVLTLCLLLGLCPLTPSAQAEETTTTAAGSATIEGAQSVPVGDEHAEHRGQLLRDPGREGGPADFR